MRKIIAALASCSILLTCSQRPAADIAPHIEILAWHAMPEDQHTVERYQELKDAGFTLSFSFCYGFSHIVDALESAEKAGVGVIATCNDLATDPESAVARLKGYPALRGYFLRDEPVCSLFPDLSAWADKIRKADPDHFIYLNMLPYGVNEADLGDTYENYVRRFIEEIGPGVVSFDNYPISYGGVNPTWYHNMEIMRRESEAAGLPMWGFLLCSAHDSYPYPQKRFLRAQAYTNLAYGAQGLEYFTYWSPGERYSKAPIDSDALRSFTYEEVREMNMEIHAREFVFAGSSVEGVWHTGETVPEGTVRLDTMPSGIKSLDTHGQGAFLSVLRNGDSRYAVVVNRSIDDYLGVDIEFDNPDAGFIRKDGSLQPCSLYQSYWRAEPGSALIFKL